MVSRIETLDLSENPIGNQGVGKLKSAISKRGLNLRKLNITDCKINNDGAAEMFSNITRGGGLVRLKMSKNNVGIKKYSMNALTELLTKNPHLEYV
jgi:Ran GTPase-activating protein (RanGAP) involved in mRNA processing and transport